MGRRGWRRGGTVPQLFQQLVQCQLALRVLTPRDCGDHSLCGQMRRRKIGLEIHRSGEQPRGPLIFVMPKDTTDHHAAGCSVKVISVTSPSLTPQTRAGQFVKLSFDIHKQKQIVYVTLLFRTLVFPGEKCEWVQSIPDPASVFVTTHIFPGKPDALYAYIQVPLMGTAGPVGDANLLAIGGVEKSYPAAVLRVCRLGCCGVTIQVISEMHEPKPARSITTEHGVGGVKGTEVKHDFEMFGLEPKDSGGVTDWWGHWWEKR
ncbi:hypothetical protein H8959_022251 [Pygathrix nigripes]